MPSRRRSRRLPHYTTKISCTRVRPEEVLLACCDTVETDRTVDIKPDNLLVKNSPQGTQYKLCDLGDSASPNVLSNDGGHLIGAEIFCAPEVPLGVPWTTKADIWAAGATGITLVTGHYIFLPKNAPPPGDPHLSMGVLQVQNDYYGPISRESFEGLIDHPVLLSLLQQFEENYRQLPLSAVS